MGRTYGRTDWQSWFYRTFQKSYVFSNKVKDDPSKEIFKDRKYESQDPSIMLLYFPLFLIIIYIASNQKTCITEVCSITFAWVTLSFNTCSSLKVLWTTFSGNFSKNVISTFRPIKNGTFMWNSKAWRDDCWLNWTRLT